MHTNGNDFMIIDNRSNSLLFTAEKVASIANRKTGVGFDQLILLEDSRDFDVFMKIYNSDGKEAKMCGNASICVASLLFASRNTLAITIETLSASVNAALNSNGEISISIELPEQDFSELLTNNTVDKNKINFEKIHSSLIEGKLVNMGNPHIVFILKSIDDIDLLKYGSRIEKNKLFTNGINTEVVEVLSKDKLKIKFWERGAGLTLSCGSGILSAFYACYNNNLCNKKVEVLLPRGCAKVSIAKSKLTMHAIPKVSYLGEFSNE